MEKGWSDDGAESNGGCINGQIEPCASMWAEHRHGVLHRPLYFPLLKADLPRIPFTTDASLLLKNTSASLVAKLGPLDTHRYPITPPTQPALCCIFPPTLQSIGVLFFPQ